MSDKKSNTFLCNICGEVLIEPKDLECNHSCCRDCLQNYILNNARDGQFPCPKCKKNLSVPDPNRPLVDWADFYVTNYETIKKLESMRLGGKKSVEHKCVICLGKWIAMRATKHCKACQEYFCDECGNMHWLLRASKEHRIVYIEDIESMKKDPLLRSKMVAIFNARIRDVTHLLDKPEDTNRPVTPAFRDPDVGECLISGAAIMGEDYMVLVDRKNHKLKLFGANYEFLSCVRISAFGIVKVNQYFAVVTCPEEKCIQWISVFADEMEQEHRVETEEECFGICIVGDKIVLSSAGKSPCLFIMDEYNNFEKVKIPAGKLKFENPFYITYDKKKDCLYTTDTLNRCMKCIRLDGNLVWERSFPDGQGMAMYGQYLLVARKDQQTVDIVSSEGQSLKSVVPQTDGVKRPRALCVDYDLDVMIVSDDSDLVSAFALEDPLEDEDINRYFNRRRSTAFADDSQANKSSFCTVL